ncbi:MAG: hypothetical protein QUU85_12770, partial [Candidatus Eisenbacteria bacterium]|nr:hypothetical protein [Candidatus Eisenbacteria bacterium]
MLRTARRPVLAATLVVIAMAGSVLSAGPSAGVSNTLELRARRIIERHRARAEFPGAVLTVHEPSRPAWTITGGVAKVGPGASPIDPATPWICLLYTSPSPRVSAVYLVFRLLVET